MNKELVVSVTKRQLQLLDNARDDILNLTVAELQSEATTLALTKIMSGAETTEELEKMVLSRYNGKLNAIPLKDWCKDNNRNYLVVFRLLRDEGIIDEWNVLTDEGFGLVNNVDKGETVSLAECSLYNSYPTNTGRVLLVCPSAVSFQEFKRLIKHKTGKYLGSKTYTAKKVCKAMRKVCPSYTIVE